MIYHDIESGEYLNEMQLRQEFIVLKNKNETDAENFGQYVNNCLSKNGTLEIVMISVNKTSLG